MVVAHRKNDEGLLELRMSGGRGVGGWGQEVEMAMGRDHLVRGSCHCHMSVEKALERAMV